MEALQYNSERKPLIIPEYGRHMHIMVDQMLATPEREERNKKAKAIIGVMGYRAEHLHVVQLGATLSSLHVAVGPSKMRRVDAGEQFAKLGGETVPYVSIPFTRRAAR